MLEARRRLAAVRDERLAAQLGGAAGTLAALGDDALEIVRLYAQELGLAEPVLPWHANRQRVAELGAALDAAAGAAAKVGRDIVLLAQTEVGEVAEASGGRLLDDAAEAEPRPLHARGRVRAARARPRGSPARRTRSRARAGGGRLARRVGGALRCPRVRRRSGSGSGGRRHRPRGRRRADAGEPRGERRPRRRRAHLVRPHPPPRAAARRTRSSPRPRELPRFARRCSPISGQVSPRTSWTRSSTRPAISARPRRSSTVRSAEYERTRG